MARQPSSLAEDRTPQPFSLELHLEGAGWAFLDVRCGPQSTRIGGFGDTTDVLGDLLRAAICAVTSGAGAEVIVDGEPRMWGLGVERAGAAKDGSSLVRVRIAGDDGTAPMATGRLLPVDHWPVHLIDGHVAADAFGEAVATEAERLLQAHGEQAYGELWPFYGSREGFPLRALRALRAALATPQVRG